MRHFEPQTLSHLEQISEHLDTLIALGEECLSIQQRQLAAQDTQNLLAWLQLQLAQGHEPDARLMSLVRDRLQI